jgi:hypothetical protein
MKMLTEDNRDRPSATYEITKAIQSLKFESIKITVLNGKVTQIEKRAKFRWSNQTITNKPIVKKQWQIKKSFKLKNKKNG